MAKPYHYVRFEWRNVDLKKLKEEVEESFYVRLRELPRGEKDWSLLRNERDEFVVKADTLNAYLSLSRAVMFQKTPAPFTRKDIELRKKIFEFYTKTRNSPFPWGFTHAAMTDFALLATAIGLGAAVVRVGFEDSVFYAPGRAAATNVELVKRVVALVNDMGLDVATTQEARTILGVLK